MGNPWIAARAMSGGSSLRTGTAPADEHSLALRDPMAGDWRAGRREFLAWCSAAVAAGLWPAVACGAEDAQSAPLPTIALGPHRVTRLIVGSNPMAGFSYLGPEMDNEMKTYFTPERTLAFLEQCERTGINAHQFSAAAAVRTGEVLRGLRERGSKLQLIALYSKREDIGPVAKTFAPIAMAHHGGVTDRLFAQGQSAQLHDFVKAVHDQGLLAGVSSHNPDNIRRIADEGWEVDFFMTCFYYITRPATAQAAEQAPRELAGPDVGYKFYADDPARMCAVIRQLSQPCLAFKILGAGRRCANQEMVRAAFEFAFTHIKPSDAVIVGMYPRHFDQVGANAGYTCRLGATA